MAQTLLLAAPPECCLGTAASWVVSRAFSGMLFGVTASDPMTFLGMLGVLTVVSAVAGYLPARSSFPNRSDMAGVASELREPAAPAR